MSKTTIHREQARKRTRAAQAAAVLLGVSAIAIGLFAPSQLAADTRPVEPQPRVPEEPEREARGTDEAEEPSVNFDIIASQLRLIANRPQPAPEPEQDPTDQQAGADEPDSPAVAQEPEGESDVAGRQIRYLGAIVEPDRIIALVSIDDQQRLAKAGRKYDGVSIAEVTRGAVRVIVNDEERWIERSDREGPAVTFTDASNSPMPSVPRTRPVNDLSEEQQKRRQEALERIRRQQEEARRRTGRGNRE